MSATKLPSYFISHGGGPWPWMRAQSQGRYDKLALALSQMPQAFDGPPRAVLMVSAHWECPQFTVMANPRPPMLYDYYGFPEETYRVSYPAPGAPHLVERVRGLLADAGIASDVDAERGFDHGTFSPMALIYPKADVPVLQLSLKVGLDPAEHLAAGRALAALRSEQVLIVGSGLSYHNLRAFGPVAREPSAAFDAWLGQALSLTGEQREAALCDWERAPAARQAHPREEHLLPLMVALGASPNDTATLDYHEDNFVGGVTVSSFRFDAR